MSDREGYPYGDRVTRARREVNRRVVVKAAYGEVLGFWEDFF